MTQLGSNTFYYSLMFFINPFPQFSHFMVTVTQNQGLMAPNGQWIRVEHVKIHSVTDHFLCACIIKLTLQIEYIQNNHFLYNKKTNWETYKAILDEKITWNIPLKTAEDI